MGMGRFVVPSLYGEEQSIWIFPGAAEEDALACRKHRVERPQWWLWWLGVTLIPDQIKRFSLPRLIREPLLLPRERRVRVASRQPEHSGFRRKLVCGVAVVERSIGGP